MSHTKCPECNLIFTPKNHEDEIKTLRAENARYRKALEFIADGKIAASSIKYRYIDEAYQECAREALKGGE